MQHSTKRNRSFHKIAEISNNGNIDITTWKKKEILKQNITPMSIELWTSAIQV